jgi:hypothetical protein
MKTVGVGLLAALVVAAAGLLLERARFGESDAAAVSRIHDELQQRVDRTVQDLTAMAARLDAQRADIRAAARDSAAATRLFDALDRLVPADQRHVSGISIYSAAGAPVAWAGQVSEVPTPAARRGATVLMTGAPMPRLLRVEPLVDQSRPGSPLEATIVAEEALSSSPTAGTPPGTFMMPTSIVPVTLSVPRGLIARSDAYRFSLASADGAIAVEGVVLPDDLAAARAEWSHATWALVLVVLSITVLLGGGPLVERRRRTQSSAVYLAATGGLVAVVLAAYAMTSQAVTLWLAPAPPHVAIDLIVRALMLALLVWIVLDLIGRRRYARPKPRLIRQTVASELPFAVAYALSGAAAVWILWRYEGELQSIVAGTNLDLLHFSHYSLKLESVAFALGLALLHTTIIWLAAAAAHVPGLVWRVSRKLTSVIAVSSWILGVIIAGWWLASNGDASIPRAPLFLAVGTAGVVAAALSSLRTRMRHASQATRLLWLFLALLVPAVVMYPSVAALTVDEREWAVAARIAPGAASLREDLQIRVRHAIEQIDAALEEGPDNNAGGAASETGDPAFRLWSRTDLAKYRLTSAVELYGADQRLVSRFALNLPEATANRYQADSCEWSEFDEASPFGSNQNVLHYSRDICAGGRVLGAVVVRAMLDYRTLPFLASQSPYLDVFQNDQRPRADTGPVENLEFVVYGWSRAPLFASGTSVWALPDEAFQHMVASRQPVWADIDRNGETYRVYLFNDRSAIYALGYPVTTWFGHLINLVELSTLILAPLYLTLLLMGALFNFLTSRTPSGGRALLREIRSSFYRKLFLYYVAGAVVPVVILAFLTRTYFATELRAGIDEAAAKTATVAQRLVEDYTTLQQRGPGALGAIDDQLMVLVGQAIDHDVSLFDRARLQASSERDLFESQLLSTRTPADVYRTIILDRLPTFVAEERVGDVRYRLAAAPVRAGGREGVDTVPLT